MFAQAFLMLALTLFAQTNGAVAQSATKSPQDLTAQREKGKAIEARRDELRKNAKAVLEREMAREKAGDCPEATSTADTNACLAKEIETTKANYKKYIDDLHSMLGFELPGETDQGVQAPEGAARQFDEVEKAWQTYQKARCSAIYDNFRPGTIAPQMGADCQQRLTRNHMRELDEIYDPILWH